MAVAIQKRVDGFELGVGQSAADEQGNAVACIVKKVLQLSQGIHELVRRRWDEDRIAQVAAAPPDPVLRGAEFAWQFVATAYALP